jgi:hypothetical protein
VAGAVAEKEVERRIQELACRFHSVQQRIELGIETRERVAVEQPLDDDATVLVEDLDDPIDRITACRCFRDII